ncbi:MAG: hypothetical protein ACK4WF_07110, partial [Candidatus Brocadiales bacterium]
YLEILTELGIVGITAFLAIVFSAILSLKNTKQVARRLGDNDVKNWATGLGVGLSGFLVGGFFHSVQNNKFFWLTIFLAVVLNNLPKDTSRHAMSTIIRQRLYFLKSRTSRLAPVYRRSL